MNIRQFSEFNVNDILIDSAAGSGATEDSEDLYGDEDFEEELVNYDDKGEFEEEDASSHVIDEGNPIGPTVPSEDEYHQDLHEDGVSISEGLSMNPPRLPAAESASPRPQENEARPQPDVPVGHAPTTPSGDAMLTDPLRSESRHVARMVQLSRSAARRRVSRVAPVSALNLPPQARKPTRAAPPPASASPRHIDSASEHQRIQRRAIPVKGFSLGNGFAALHRDDVISKELDKVVLASERTAEKELSRNVACQTVEVRRSSLRRPSRLFAKFPIDPDAAATALRLGTDRYALMETYERVHSAFLSDLIGRYLLLDSHAR